MKFGNMSRIGKKTIEIPQGVQVDLKGSHLTIRGPKGELSQEILADVEVRISDNIIQVVPARQSAEGPIPKNTRAIWGLTRALLANMVHGVTEGFERRLELEGIGYRVALDGTSLVLTLGYSHPVIIQAPQDIVFAVEGNTIIVSGASKEEVGQWAAKIRFARPVEPYKGKGLRYQDEIVRRKEGGYRKNTITSI